MPKNVCAGFLGRSVGDSIACCVIKPTFLASDHDHSRSDIVLAASFQCDKGAPAFSRNLHAAYQVDSSLNCPAAFVDCPDLRIHYRPADQGPIGVVDRIPGIHHLRRRAFVGGIPHQAVRAVRSFFGKEHPHGKQVGFTLESRRGPGQTSAQETVPALRSRRSPALRRESPQDRIQFHSWSLVHQRPQGFFSPC